MRVLAGVKNHIGDFHRIVISTSAAGFVTMMVGDPIKATFTFDCLDDLRRWAEAVITEANNVDPALQMED